LTPLNSIINLSEMMLEDEQVSPDLKEMLKIVWSSGKVLEFNIKSQLSQMQI